jgi:hypothetical protein
MLQWLRVLLVSGLERLDTAIDYIPGFGRCEGEWYFTRYSHWGCRLKLALLAAVLDERWGTGQWREVTEWTVAYIFAGSPDEDELMALQHRLDEDAADGAVSAVPARGQWRISFGVRAERPADALRAANDLLTEFSIHADILAVDILTSDELERRAQQDG